MGYFNILSQEGLFFGFNCNMLLIKILSYLENRLGIGSNLPTRTELASPSMSSALKGTSSAVIS